MPIRGLLVAAGFVACTALPSGAAADPAFGSVLVTTTPDEVQTISVGPVTGCMFGCGRQNEVVLSRSGRGTILTWKDDRVVGRHTFRFAAQEFGALAVQIGQLVYRDQNCKNEITDVGSSRLRWTTNFGEAIVVPVLGGCRDDWEKPVIAVEQAVLNMVEVKKALTEAQ